MRTLLVALLLAAALPAGEPATSFSTADDWDLVDGNGLRLGCLAWPIRLPEVARRLGADEAAARAYLAQLDPKLPLLVEQDAEHEVVGLWPVTGELLAKELRLELKLPETAKARETVAFEVKLVNAGRAPHRVVRPNDGSESGWREPEVVFEMEVDGAWVRAGKPGRCGIFAHDWHKDVLTLGPGEALPLEAYLPPNYSFDLTQPGKVRLRALYIYRGGFMARAPDKKPDPGPMGKTPPFTLVSNVAEVELTAP
jgi:hypothetical protein